MSWKKLLGMTPPAPAPIPKPEVKPMTAAESEDALFEATNTNLTEAEKQRRVLDALDRGADIETYIYGNMISGQTVLHYFCETKNADMVKELLCRGANPNKPTDHGLLPIVICRSYDIFRILVEGGADLSQLMGPNPMTQSPALHYMNWPGFNRKMIEAYVSGGADYIGCYDKTTALATAIAGMYSGTSIDGKGIYNPVHYAIEIFAEAGVPVSDAQRAAYAPLDERCKKAEALWQSWHNGGCDVTQIDYPSAMLFSNIGKLDALLQSHCWQGHEAQLAGLCAQFPPALFERFCTHRPALMCSIATPQTVIEGWSAALDMSPAQPMQGRG